MTALDSHAALVCGAGSIGSRHARNLRALGIRDITVCDPDAERRGALAAELGCPAFATIGEALAARKPSVVFVCSPTKEHVPQALQAAQAGAHLFIEKPLSSTREGVDELRCAVEEQKRICMVGCNMRFHFGPRTVKRLLEEGAIGKVSSATVYTGSYLPDWRPQSDYRRSYSADPVQGGAVLDCIHEIDLALWYLGPGRLIRTTGTMATAIGIPVVEGTVDCTIEHATGALSRVHLSFEEKTYRRWCEIRGERGSMHWDFERKTVAVRDTNGKPVREFRQPPAEDTNDMYRLELRYFFDCIAAGEEPEGNLAEAEAALEIALAARDAIRSAQKPGENG